MLLAPEEAELFYKLHWALMLHTNRHLTIIPDATSRDEILRLPLAERMEIREALYQYPELLESFIAESSEDFTPDELAIAASWQHRVSGDFYIIRYLKRYAVLLCTAKPQRLYGVSGLTQTLDEVFFDRPLPICVQAVLLPFKDRITYDGLMSTYNVYFGSGIQSELRSTYNRLKRREGIVEQLVGPDGKPQIRTSLDRRRPRKPPPDWTPVVDEIVARAEKIRRTDKPAQGAAASLLRAAAKVCRATLCQPDATQDHLDQLSSVRRALTKLENILCEDLYEM